MGWKQLLKAILKITPLYYPLLNWRVKILQEKEVAEWERQGKQAPPPHLIKQQTLQDYANRFGLKILVETGTYMGDMVEAMKRSFDLIYSIELSRGLCEQARKRFAKVDHVTIIHGDSGLELGNILKRINQPALFWLDGHYSGGGTAKGKKDTPIYEELDQILSVPVQGHVIIIDDARCFGKDPAYPSVEELTNFIRSKRPDAAIELRHDMIRVTPNP